MRISEFERKTILLVEDEMIVSLAQKYDLEREGYRVIQAASGEKALSIVCAKKEPVDLILMDIDLGKGMDGTQAAQEILKSREIPIVFLSSHADREIIERAGRITSYGYIVKDADTSVLMASIRKAFILSQSHRSLR
ncbi:MAG TPA: response regulator [Bacteroidota bacterium]|nr:response regulator [Bacteroidota bacterium]